MQRKIGEHDWYQVKGFSGAWSRDPWIASSMIDGHDMAQSTQRVIGFQQQYDFAAYATRNRVIADTVALPELQTMALAAWEDDGGTLEINTSINSVDKYIVRPEPVEGRLPCEQRGSTGSP